MLLPIGKACFLLRFFAPTRNCEFFYTAKKENPFQKNNVPPKTGNSAAAGGKQPNAKQLQIKLTDCQYFMTSGCSRVSKI